MHTVLKMIAKAHTGDFGNIKASDNKVAGVYINDSFVQLHGEASIVGRDDLMHEEPDDLGKGENEE